MSNIVQKTPVVALAGQPNCGKSTIFNLLTGARQFVANYPGVTVDKMYGSCTIENQKVSIVDLPGTYAFTSYSKEEMAAREFILNDSPDLIVAVVDASTLDKGLYFVLQLLEMGKPVVVALNMIDVAHRRGLYPDAMRLSEALNVPVVPLQATKKNGSKDLLEIVGKVIAKNTNSNSYQMDYNELTPFIEKLAQTIERGGFLSTHPPYWIALKLFEDDSAVLELIQKNSEMAKEIIPLIQTLKEEISEKFSKTALAMLTFERHTKARTLFKASLGESKEDSSDSADDSSDKHIYTPSLTDRIDSVLCHRILGPICLFAILFVFYQVSVTLGNDLAARVWPLWASVETFFISKLPIEGFIVDPIITFFGNWLVKSLTAIMNYLPIFFLMFGFVAILEDSGYLARIAFVLDKIFNIFGLHGQSTLPLIIGGIYVGGCAIPGVVATRAIPDERARFATIMIVPMMNCLAKVPLYLLLIGVFFANEAGSSMFFMGTITLIVGLIVAKVLSLTILRSYPPSPFIIELPSYHMPTFRNVINESFRRVAIFIKKIFTVVLTVSSVVFLLIYFPNLSEERTQYFANEQTKLETGFLKAVDKTDYAGQITQKDIVPLLIYQSELRAMKMGKNKDQAATINDEELKANPLYASIILRKTPAGKSIFGALRKVDSKRKGLRRNYSTERFEGSYLGRAGKAIEPITAGAGFTWRINVALLSALAAKENSAATLGALYGIDGATTAESFKEQESSFTPLHALALMLFMAFYPPCLATAMMVRAQTASTKWMLFAILFQITLGLGIATLVFSLGTMLGFTGVEAMWTFYGFCFLIMLIIGFIPIKAPDYSLQALKT